MKKLLELARDVTQFEKLKRSQKGVRYIKDFALISEIASSDVKRVKLVNKDVIDLANKISNYEPTILVGSGEILTMGNIRIRTDVDKEEMKIVQDKLWVYFEPMKISKRRLFDKAVKHMLTGCEATSDRMVAYDVALASVIAADPEDSLSKLIGYAIAFNCPSVAKLGDLFTFHYVDKYDQAEKQGMVSYSFCGKTYESMVTE